MSVKTHLLVLTATVLFVMVSPFTLFSLSLQWEQYDPKSGVLVLRDATVIDSLCRTHLAWLKDHGLDKDTCISELDSVSLADVRRFKISHSEVRGRLLTDRNLRFAVMDTCTFDSAQFDFSDLTGAMLRGCNLLNTFFRNATLNYSDLSGSAFQATLSNTKFIGVNMSEIEHLYVNLSEMDLSYSKFYAINRYMSLNGVNLYRSKVTNVIYEILGTPEGDALRNFAYAIDLDYLRYESDQSGLLRLMRAFREQGYHAAEKQVQAALHREHYRRNRYDIDLVHVFGPVTGYGAKPLLPLCILFVLVWPIFGLIHSLLIIKNIGKYEISFLDSGIKRALGHRDVKGRYSWPHLGLAFLHGFLYSLMCLFNIRFRELELSRWLRSLWKEDFIISTKGLPRVFGGIQSLIGLVLLSSIFLALFSNVFNI